MTLKVESRETRLSPRLCLAEECRVSDSMTVFGLDVVSRTRTKLREEMVLTGSDRRAQEGTTELEDEYREIVVVHDREFQKYSVDRNINLMPIDDVSGTRLGSRSRLMTYRKRRKGSNSNTRRSVSFSIAVSSFHQWMIPGPSSTAVMEQPHGLLKWQKKIQIVRLVP